MDYSTRGQMSDVTRIFAYTRLNYSRFDVQPGGHVQVTSMLFQRPAYYDTEDLGQVHTCTYVVVDGTTTHRGMKNTVLRLA